MDESKIFLEQDQAMEEINPIQDNNLSFLDTTLDQKYKNTLEDSIEITILNNVNYDKTIIQDIATIIDKVEKKSIQYMQRLNDDQINKNIFEKFLKLGSSFEKTKKIINMILMQVGTELVQSQMEDVSISFQKIFNIQNFVITELIKYQLEYIKQRQNQEKQRNIDQLIKQKADKLRNIPQFLVKTIETQQKAAIDEQLSYLKQEQIKLQEKSQFFEASQKQVNNTIKQINETEIETQENISICEKQQYRIGQTKIQKYSNALGDLRQSTRDNFQTLQKANIKNFGLNSFQDLLGQHFKKNTVGDLDLFAEDIKFDKDTDFPALIKKMQGQFALNMQQMNNTLAHTLDQMKMIQNISESLILKLRACTCQDQVELNDMISNAQFQIQSVKNQEKIIKTTIIKQNPSLENLVQKFTEQFQYYRKKSEDQQQSYLNLIVKKIQKSSKQTVSTQTSEVQNIKASLQLNLNNQSNIQNQSNVQQQQKQPAQNFIWNYMSRNDPSLQLVQNFNIRLKQFNTPSGVTLKFDKDGKVMVDKKGNPLFVDKSGREVKVTKNETYANLQPEIIQKQVQQKFIYHDGIKVEVQQNKNGQYFVVDITGKKVILENIQEDDIMIEQKTVEEIVMKPINQQHNNNIQGQQQGNQSQRPNVIKPKGGVYAQHAVGQMTARNSQADKSELKNNQKSADKYLETPNGQKSILYDFNSNDLPLQNSVILNDTQNSQLSKNRFTIKTRQKEITDPVVLQEMLEYLDDPKNQEKFEKIMNIQEDQLTPQQLQFKMKHLQIARQFRYDKDGNDQCDDDGRKIFQIGGENMIQVFTPKGVNFNYQKANIKVLNDYQKNLNKKNSQAVQIFTNRGSQDIQTANYIHNQVQIDDPQNLGNQENGVLEFRNNHNKNINTMPNYNVITNKDGQQFISDSNGNTIPIQVDQNGNKYVVSKTGTKISLQELQNAQKNGNPSIINKFTELLKNEAQKINNNNNNDSQEDKNELQKAKKNRNPSIINKFTGLLKNEAQNNNNNKNNDLQEDKDDSVENKQKPLIITNSDGIQVLVDKKTGKQFEIKVNFDGKQFYKDEKGQIFMVNQKDQPKVITDETGRKIITVGGKQQELQKNSDGKLFFINQNNEVQIVQDDQPEIQSDEEQEIPDWVDETGRCKYCKQIYKNTLIKKKKNKQFDVQMDENGEMFIQDQNGNKIFVQKNAKGQLYYINDQGMFMKVNSDVRVIRFANIRKSLIEKEYKNIKTESTLMFQKLALMDMKSQIKLMGIFIHDEYQDMIQTANGLDDQTPNNLQVYEFLKNLEGNYDMSEENFVSSFKKFQIDHQNCQIKQCEHLDIYFKKLIIQNQFYKIRKRFTQKQIVNFMNPKLSKAVLDSVISLKDKMQFDETEISVKNELVTKLKNQLDSAIKQIQDNLNKQDN